MSFPKLEIIPLIKKLPTPLAQAVCTSISRDFFIVVLSLALRFTINQSTVTFKQCANYAQV